MFKLYTDLIKSKQQYYVFQPLERLRKRLLQDQRTIHVKDLGAGSRMNLSSKRTIARIARHTLAPRKEAQLLFRLLNFFQPKVVFELGTSLGLTTLYLAHACRGAKVYTFEGCPEVAREAQANFNRMGADNIQLIVGPIDETLPQILLKVSQVDFAFLDANHQYKPTLRYFDLCLEKAQEDTLLVVDDIHWSSGMQRAWEEIKEKPQVRQTIDLFQLGLVFFRKKQVKEHFVLKF